jgi:hypothetical protein
MTYPNVQAPYEEAAVRAAYVDGAAAAAWSALLQLLGIIPFTVFLVGLWLRLRRTEALAMIALLGGFGTMVIIQIWQGILVGLVVASTTVDPLPDVRAFLAVVTGIDQSVTLGLAIMTGAAGLAVLSGGALPRWLGGLAIVISVVATVGVLAIPIYPADPELASVVGTANPLALLLFLVWVTGVSVVFLRSSRRGPMS